MPATTRTRTRPYPAPWVWLLAGVFLLLPFAARAHDGAHLHPHGAEYLWLGLFAAGVTGAGRVTLRARR